jgi:hypothetical protein
MRACLFVLCAVSWTAAVHAQSTIAKPVCAGVFKEPVANATTSSFRFLQLRQRDFDISNPCPRLMLGNYTRLMLVRDDRDEGAAMERRGWLDRALSEKKTGKVIIARLSLSRPSLTFVTTLGNISWISGPKGQVSSSDVELNAFATPYFRVDPDTTVHVEFEVVNSSGTNVSLASDALSIIGQFARPAAGGGLINAENLPQLQRAAAGVDSAISKFFREQINEKKSIELTPDQLGLRPVTATVKLPFGWNVVGGGRDKEFGSWTLYAEEPRTSVFGRPPFGLSQTIRDKFGPYDPWAAYINGFQLTSTKTLIEQLSGSDKVSAVLADLQSSSDSKHQNESLRQLYAVLVSEAERLGFNILDSVRIADAFARSGRIRGITQEMFELMSSTATTAAKQEISRTDSQPPANQ